MKNNFKLQPRDNVCLNHPMFLNWRLTNSDGNPSLCCAVCTSKTKQRRGQPRYIRFVKTREISQLQKMGVEERF